ncbi:sortase [Pseudonocardia nigra]|uniref:sortase n=1 Tax=Pseudonocardia nigra TaxID=1921578 RepID=UPI001C5D5290|nr:class E sortase [Pseudonocardia nigra]
MVGISATLVLIVPMLTPDISTAPASGRADEQSQREPPSWDAVLRLRGELAASAANNPDYPIDPEQAALVATAPQAYTPLGRVTSPAIGLDAGYAAGVHPSVLERGPGLWPGTVSPGQPGNAVLSGHRTTHTRPFADLDQLAPGDPIVVTTNSGQPVTFRVTETAIVLEAEYVDFVLASPADPATRQLTLFACHPKGDRTHRIVVRATTDTTAE